MLKKVSAIKARQNLGQVMNEVALKDDEYIVERAGKPLVAIIPVEKYLGMVREREAFFRLYDTLQGKAAVADQTTLDGDLDEALKGKGA